MHVCILDYNHIIINNLPDGQTLMSEVIRIEGPGGKVQSFNKFGKKIKRVNHAVHK